MPLQQPTAIFLLVLVIILAVPLVFSRLKIPYIIGMIICGAVVGPHGFNLLSRDASFEIFGQVGLLYLMFLAGAQIDMYHLKNNLRNGLIFGLISFLIPTIMGILVFRVILGYPWELCLLVCSMLSSHTLITYPAVTRFGITNARPVAVAVSGTVVSIFLALILLAQVGVLAEAGHFSIWGPVMLIAKVGGYCVVVGWVYPILARLFFSKFSETINQFIFILALVFFASLLAQIIGIEAILGAFYAGLILNRFLPANSQLMRRTEFVGNAIFIPYFLIGVGMLIDVHILFEGWKVIACAALMIFIALSSKWLPAIISQKLFKFSKEGGKLLFGLSSGKAAATLAATMIGYRYGFLDETFMNAAVLMILACCAVASFETERAAMRLRITRTQADLDRGPDQERRNARQLVAVANPLTAADIMKLAIYMRHSHNRVPLTTLFVRNSDDARVLQKGKEAMERAVRVARAADIEVKQVERYDLNIVTGLINASKEQDATDIVLGLHRRTAIVDSFFGTLTEQLLSQTTKMVILSRCFMPVDTLSRIVVVSPPKAEYETGFRKWVERIGNLSTQLSYPVTFIAHQDTIPYIRGVLTSDGYEIDYSFSPIKTWDDFILHTNRIDDDNLLIMIGARRSSISFDDMQVEMPDFLTKYFSRHNLVMIYPEQFGAVTELVTPIDPLSQVTTTNPTPSWYSLRRFRDIRLKQKK